MAERAWRAAQDPRLLLEGDLRLYLGDLHDALAARVRRALTELGDDAGTP